MPPASSCADFRQTRRDLLRLGTLGLFLPGVLRGRALARPAEPRGSFGRARSVIVLYLHGGHAQQETWDPKPDGPEQVRGEFGALATRIPGVRVSELLPRCAALLDRLAVVRSLSHPNANHVQASLPAMTGHAHPPETEARGDFPPAPTDFPPFGAVLSRVRPAATLPTWVQLGPLMRRNNGTVLHGQLPGFLGSRFGPLVVDQDLLPGDVRVEALAAGPEAKRLADRGNLLARLDAERRVLDRVAEVRDLDAYQRQALNLLTSPATARAFDLAGEPEAVREAYGRTEFGQRCLLARRLAEAGVPLVNVHWCRTPNGSWDTHGRHFSQMKESLCPVFDRAFAALVADLEQRGLLGRTLVLATAEFGRTPTINKAAGRDHWPWVYSVAMAGGGAAAGVVHGASDRSAAYPTAQPHDPADLAATVYHLLGVPAETQVHDATGRPHTLVIGNKIDPILA